MAEALINSGRAVGSGEAEDRAMAVEWVIAAGVLVVASVLLWGFSAWMTRRIEAAVPGNGRFVEVDGERFHYDDEGKGPALVMIHGLMGSSRNLTYALSGQLRQHFRVISVDRPGSGYSTRYGGGPAGPGPANRCLYSDAGPGKTAGAGAFPRRCDCPGTRPRPSTRGLGVDPGGTVDPSPAPIAAGVPVIGGAPGRVASLAVPYPDPAYRPADQRCGGQRRVRPRSRSSGLRHPRRRGARHAPGQLLRGLHRDQPGQRSPAGHGQALPATDPAHWPDIRRKGQGAGLSKARPGPGEPGARRQAAVGGRARPHAADHRHGARGGGGGTGG